MSWSLPDPRPAEPVLGDPASLGALAAALRRTGTELEDSIAALAEAPVHRRYAGRVRALHRDTSVVVEALRRVAPYLVDHSGELADAIGLARRLSDRAQSLGLQIDGPTVAAPRGVRGGADPAAEQVRGAALCRLQRVLDAILIDLDTSRRRLRAELDSERARVHSRVRSG